MTAVENLSVPEALSPALFNTRRRQSAPANWPVAILALMMFLVPALGVPSDLMLHDTFKSAIAAFGVLVAAIVFFWQQRHRTAPLLWLGLNTFTRANLPLLAWGIHGGAVVASIWAAIARTPVLLPRTLAGS